MPELLTLTAMPAGLGPQGQHGGQAMRTRACLRIVAFLGVVALSLSALGARPAGSFASDLGNADFHPSAEVQASCTVASSPRPWVLLRARPCAPTTRAIP